MWEAVEARTREVGMGETEGGRGKEESRGKERGKREKKEEKTKKGKNNGSKESSRRMGNMGRGGRSGKIGRGSKEVGAREFSQVD